jgi:hypothetical protein
MNSSSANEPPETARYDCILHGVAKLPSQECSFSYLWEMSGLSGGSLGPARGSLLLMQHQAISLAVANSCFLHYSNSREQ